MFFSDHTLKVWSMDGLSDNVTAPINLKAKAVVAAHDKDINCVAVAPNDSLVCSGSQVSIISCRFLWSLY
jgi:U3 small nucleolar RNA-associated protein 13